MRNFFLRRGVAIAALLVPAACSSSSASGPDGGEEADAFLQNDAATPLDESQPDATARSDAGDAGSDGADAALDGSQADATARGDAGDAGFDGPDAACAKTVVDFCAAEAGCPDTCECFSDWTTAVKNARAYCMSGDRVYLYPQCDGFDLLVVGYTDTSTFFYYDPSSLALIRIEGHGNGASGCAAGTPGPVVPLTDCFDGAVPPASLCDVEAGPD